MILLAIYGMVILFNLILSSRIFRVRWSEDMWVLPFVAFLVIAAVSLLRSPYFALAASKGAIQIGGIAFAILTAYGMAKQCARNPRLIGTTSYLIAVVMGLVAAVGVAQFIFWNVFGLDRVLNFSFMNEIYGRILWRESGAIGGIARINSILAEPAYLTRILGLGCGLALVRLGVVGVRMKEALRDVVPLWAALAILICYALSTSLMGYIHVVLVAVSAWVVAGRVSTLNVVRFSVLSAMTIFATALFVGTLGEEFVEKASTIELIAGADSAESSGAASEQSQSALAIALHLELALENVLTYPLLGVGIGAHPQSYHAKLGEVSDAIKGLNVDDATGLGLRLMSETGLLGLGTFLFALFWQVPRIRRAILAIGQPGTAELGCRKALAVALLSSWIGMSVIYIARTGLYFDAAFWVSLGLLPALPKLLGTNKALPSTHA